MRVLAAYLVALCLIASPIVTSAKGAGANGAGPDSPAPAKAESTIAASDLQQLRDLIEAQSEQLREQQRELKQQQAEMQALREQITAGSANGTVVAAAPVIGTTVTAGAIGPVVAPAHAQAAAQGGTDLGKRIDALETRIKNIGPFSFSGDFRLRDEPFFGGPINNSQQRNRARYRLRFYVNAKLNSDIAGGFAFATGDPNDPITTNQTLNQFFTRHPFLLDRAFIVYTPHQFKPLTLTGGKMAYPWYRTELTWDNDINPEGIAEKLEWQNAKWPLLHQVALVGFQLPFGETTQNTALTTFRNGVNAQFPYPDASVHQSVVYGGQLQTRWALGSWLTVTADSAFYNWHNADPIALANQVANASSPGLGVYKLANTLTNSFQTTTQSFTVPVTSGTGGTTTVNSAVVAAKLNSKFALWDSILQFDIKTPSAAWPVRFLADYVQNTEACGNHPNLAPALPTALPTNAVVTVTTTNGACNSHARRGTWLEARFGRQANKGDWQFSYTHMLVDREAVMSLYNFSDMRQGSAVTQNRMEVFYQAHPNVQLGFTGFFGRQMGTTDATETLLKRYQFDVVYKF